MHIAALLDDLLEFLDVGTQVECAAPMFVSDARYDIDASPVGAREYETRNDCIFGAVFGREDDNATARGAIFAARP